MPFPLMQGSRRLRSLILLLLVVICLWLGLHSSIRSSHQISIDANFDIVRARKGFRDPIYSKWPESGQDTDANLAAYWKQLSNTSPKELESPHANFDLEPRIYKKTKWMVNAKKALRRKLHDEGSRLDDSHVQDLEVHFRREAYVVSQLEQNFVDHVRHLRIVGKLFLHKSPELKKLLTKNSRAVMKTLIPWLKDPDLLFDELMSTTKDETGVLITVSKHSQLSTQLDRVARLIRVLRLQENELPIQIAFSGENTIPAKTQDFLLKVASTDYDKAGLNTGSSFPKQTLSFINIDKFIRPGTAITDNLVYFVAIIFSNFRNVAVINSQTIPMTKIAPFFENEQFLSEGVYFFKDRPSLSKPEPFPPGFFEINELVNRYAAVSAREASLFHLQVPKKTHTKRVTDLGFRQLLDPSMAIFSKDKAFSGLIISSILPLHSVLKPKYDISTQLNPELIWLGQELAGTCSYVPFNPFFASAPGVPTPPENLPEGTLSQEICSSSWSQVSGDDKSLIYVTSHQLENRVLAPFKAAVRRKLTVQNKNLNGESELDDSLARDTVDKNLLYIKAVLQPVSVEKAHINNEGQPFVSSEPKDEFGSANDYWCAYDIVGSINSANRGLVYDYKEADSHKFLTYLNVWVQDPELEIID
ncbi:hypothetical protein OXX59_003048 [Metschnikowia pulcherrima]